MGFKLFREYESHLGKKKHTRLHIRALARNSIGINNIKGTLGYVPISRERLDILNAQEEVAQAGL